MSGRSARARWTRRDGRERSGDRRGSTQMPAVVLGCATKKTSSRRRSWSTTTARRAPPFRLEQPEQEVEGHRGGVVGQQIYFRSPLSAVLTYDIAKVPMTTNLRPSYPQKMNGPILIYCSLPCQRYRVP